VPFKSRHMGLATERALYVRAPWPARANL